MVENFDEVLNYELHISSEARFEPANINAIIFILLTVTVTSFNYLRLGLLLDEYLNIFWALSSLIFVLTRESSL